MTRTLFAVLLAAASLAAQTDNHGRVFFGLMDASTATVTKPAKMVANVPTTCDQGEFFFVTGVAAGQNVYACPTANNPVQMGGSGAGVTMVDYRYYAAAKCQNTIAGAGFSLPSTGAPTAVCAANTDSPITINAVLQFADSGTQEVFDRFAFPTGWTGAVDLAVKWRSAVANASIYANWQVQTKCVGDGETVSGAAWNAAQSIKDANKGTANQQNDATLAGVTTDGCAAGKELHFRFFRDPAHADDTLGATAELVSLQWTIRRTL